MTFYNNAKNNMLAVGESSLAEETQRLNSCLSRGMESLQVTAITVEYMMRNDAGQEKIQGFLTKESERYRDEVDSNFTGVYGVINGEYIDGIGWIPDSSYIPQERQWYTAAKEAGGKTIIVEPYIDAQTGNIMISVSRLLYDNESVISLDIILEEIQNITKNINLHGMGYGFIVDGNGLVIAHSDENEIGRNYRDDNNMSPLFARIYNECGTTFHTRINGTDCAVFTNSVMDSWYVTMVVTNDKLYHDVRDIVIQNVSVCVVIFILVTFFCTRTFRGMQWHMNRAEESRRRVESLNTTIMRTLARTIDAKDRYTNGHSQRVARYSSEIAKRMGKSKQEQKDVYYAALLHDVGKIRIPDSIINKPSRLTDEEFSFVKLHTTSGYYILRDIKENQMIVQGAKWHHERYDGRGYPNGLSGKNIPEIARIIGVADAYDAMTSNRSYRNIMQQQDVRAEIENGRNSQFDPEIADIMLEMIDEDKSYTMRQENVAVKKILAVDDEQETLELIRNTLGEELGYNVFIERTGRDAIGRISGINPDLVLLDIQMPNMNGFKVYEELRKSTDVPIVFMTSVKSIEIIDRINALGMKDYIIKPFIPQVLREIIHNIFQENTEIEAKQQ